MEGIEVHYPLEAAERELPELDRALMETRLKALSPKVGAVLFQLPPPFSKNRERLASFLHMLPRCYPYASSFATRAGMTTTFTNSFVRMTSHFADHHDAPSPWEVTARHIYLRGHGPDGRYKNHYPDRKLRTWARHIAEWRRERRTVFVYFDNDQKSAAPTDARRLVEILQRTGRK
jgi:uncharacterized protein YecE (DUF72 family)